MLGKEDTGRLPRSVERGLSVTPKPQAAFQEPQIPIGEGSMRSVHWPFLPMRTGELNIDPVQGEFFTSRDIPDRLVRETLQNSLDESLSGQRVQVRLLSSGIVRCLPTMRASTLVDLRSTWKHALVVPKNSSGWRAELNVCPSW